MFSVHKVGVSDVLTGGIHIFHLDKTASAKQDWITANYYRYAVVSPSNCFNFFPFTAVVMMNNVPGFVNSSANMVIENIDAGILGFAYI